MMEDIDFSKHKYMFSFYISSLYIFMRIWGLPSSIEPIVYILTWLSVISGIIYLIVRRLKGKPLISYFWWKLTHQRSDILIFILKCLVLIDLLKNPIKTSKIDLTFAISISIIYAILIGRNIYTL